MIKSYLLNSSVKDAKLNVKHENNSYIFEYTCVNYYECTYYVLEMQPGIYKFELYGASGGSGSGHVPSYRFTNGSCISQDRVKRVNGNTVCKQLPSTGGAGAYISGYSVLFHPMKAFATIWGMGYFDQRNSNCYKSFSLSCMNRGGYGGGGSSPGYASGSGGGQTAVKFEKNDLFHRVIVSGGGGGSDNGGGTLQQSDDGSGGAGGLEAQGFYIDGMYIENLSANSTFGFSFGQGESSRTDGSKNPYGIKTPHGFTDRGSAGGGWFGGFCSHHNNGGAGGGSSLVLSDNAILPKGELTFYDENYEEIGKDRYAYDTSASFKFFGVQHESGVWEGHRKLIITYYPLTSHCLHYIHFNCNAIMYACSLS